MDLSVYKTSKDATVEDVEDQIKKLEHLAANSDIKRNKGYHLIEGHLEINRAILEALKNRKKVRRYR